MAFPYDYNCDHKIDNENGFKGRQSENLLNGEMHNVLESIRHLSDYPENKNETPVAKHTGSLWLDQRRNELYNWRGKGYKHPKIRNGWLPIFADKFRITDEIMNDVVPQDPVLGQLWIYGGVLLYYDGINWNPIKALEQLDSQFNTAMFNDFAIFSPLNRLGSIVFPEDKLKEHIDLQRRYKQGLIDLDKDDLSLFYTDTFWNPILESLAPDYNTGNETGLHNPANGFFFTADEAKERLEKFVNMDLKFQYLVPDIKIDRVFIDNKLDIEYNKQSRSVIEYSLSKMVNYEPDESGMVDHVKRPSLIHMNPGKMTNITKRIFKIDRTNPKIFCSAHNTEFYGFKANDPYGELLLPVRNPFETTKEDVYKFLNDKNYGTDTSKNKDYLTDPNYTVNGDYECQNDGIFLVYNTCQKYDYVLAITYEFSWINATGIMRQIDNRSGSNSFYIPHKLGDVNIFINGFDYEDTYYTFDHENQTLTVAEDITRKDLFDIAVLGVYKHEYGFIRRNNLPIDGSDAIITAVHKFNRPLLFVNGEVLNRSEWSYFDRDLSTDIPSTSPIKTTSFRIPTAKRDMCWTIIDMQKKEHEYDSFGAEVSTITTDICIEDDGIIDDTSAYRDSNGNPAIPIPNGITIACEEIPGFSYSTTLSSRTSRRLVKDGEMVIADVEGEEQEILIKNTDSDVDAIYRPQVVLFVQGLMVKREDIYYELSTNTLTCNGLKPGMKYVLLNDPDEVLYTEETKKAILPALSIGKIDQTLVYYNGYLLNEPTSYLYAGDESYAANFAYHGEIRAFDEGTNFKVFDCIDKEGEWLPLDEKTGEEVKSFSNSYVNTATAVSFADNISTSLDNQIIIYGFKFSNAIENPLCPVTCWLHQNDEGRYFMKEAGYSDEYIELVKNEQDTKVNIDKLDPTDPESMKDYKARNKTYYDFLIARFNSWCSEMGPALNGKTLAEKIKLYKEDSKKPSAVTSTYLIGYFYDGVYCKDKSEEEAYIGIRDKARGKLWANKCFIGKDYNPDKDYVMVWLNGVRQYPDKDVIIVPRRDENNVLVGYDIKFAHYEGDNIVPHVDEDGFIEIPRGEGFTVNYSPYKEPLTGLLTYIIQRADINSGPVCRYKILNNTHMLEGSQNVYTTKEFKPEYIDPKSFIRDNSNDFSMYPGRVTIYADGIRLPRECYTIMDNNTLVIEDTEQFFGNKKNYPTFKYVDHNGDIAEGRRLQPENILIEVREDNDWTERTLDLKNFNGDFQLFAADSDLPTNIMNTTDTILIFVDGLYHGLTMNDGYVINKQKGLISIRDYTVLNAIRRDDLETYVKIHPEILEVQNEEVEAYRLRKKDKNHYLIIEWR